MIEKKEVEYLAQLARLELEEKNLPKLEKDLASILEYVGQLKEFNLLGKAEKEEIGKGNQRLDEAKASLAKAKDLLSLAPALQKGFIKVKSIFKNGA
jgi:aspartyl/glutamyl-tRNA(Asn/Gln) amidotransferase C subunit